MKNFKYSQECMVPETFEGWAMLHVMYTVDFRAWVDADNSVREKCLKELSEFLNQNKTLPNDAGHTALFAQVGHKGDLMLLHFRKTLEDLTQVENDFAKLEISEFLSKTNSYVSYVELGMYAYTKKLFDELKAEGIEVSSDTWNQRWEKEMKSQEKRLMTRLYTDIPEQPYLCFYPMDKKRNDVNNWYTVPFEKRQSMMFEHGMIGRKYAGKINQIISGSIGFDDWEWGVDLFADDPIVFKKLVYEMRYDEASALYGEFGPFYIAYRLQIDKLSNYFNVKS